MKIVKNANKNFSILTPPHTVRLLVKMMRVAAATTTVQECDATMYNE